MSKRNPAYGYWSEEETNWSAKDTALMEELKDEEYIPASLKDIKNLMKTSSE